MTHGRFGHLTWQHLAELGSGRQMNWFATFVLIVVSSSISCSIEYRCRYSRRGNGGKPAPEMVKNSIRAHYVRQISITHRMDPVRIVTSFDSVSYEVIRENHRWEFSGYAENI